MDKTVLVPIAQGTEEIEAVVIIDLLRRAGITVKVAGDHDIITCSRGVKIIPDSLIDDLPDNFLFDAIILPGGLSGTKNLMDNEHLKKILENNRQHDRIIGAICAGPAILDSHNIINNNNKITSHPSIKESLSKYDYSEEDIVFSDNIITSRGAGTAIGFALKIIEVLVSKETSERVGKDITFIKNF